MKQKLKRWLSLLLCLTLVSTICPVEVLAAQMVTPISTAEEFMAIMEHPEGSYRLEADLDLGLIAPLGFGQIGDCFTGSLDGNGHTIRYQMSYVTDCTNYGLFFYLSDAEITNLNLYASMNLAVPAYRSDGPICVGIVGSGMASLSGLTLKGDIRCEHRSPDSEIHISGALSYGDYFYSPDAALHTVDTELSIEARTDGDLYVSGLAPYESSSYQCSVSGTAILEGDDVYSTLLNGAEDGISDLDLTITARYSEVYGGKDCSDVRIYGGCTVTDDSEYANVYALTDCTDSSFEGPITISTDDSENTDVYALTNCTDSSFEGPIKTSGYACGILYGTNCSFDGSIRAEDSIGISESTNCSFLGDIYVDDRNSLYGIYHSNSCRFQGDLSGNTSVWGMYNSSYSSFDGSIHAASEAVGAQLGVSSVVRADLFAPQEIRAMDNMERSSFEGTLLTSSCPRVYGLWDCKNSLCKVNLYGRIVTAIYGGSGNYFGGNVYATEEAGGASGGQNNAFRGNILVNSDDKGLLLSSNTDSNSFTGTAVCYARNYFHIIGENVTGYHTKTGVAANTSDGSGFPKYHTCDITDSCFGCEEVGRVDYIGSQPVGSLTLPNIDPDTETFCPDDSDNTPANYTICLLNIYDEPISDARITLNGRSYITDGLGCITVKDGPAIISPLVVELLSGDGTYFTVLSRTTYYPMPDRVNELLLEPQLELSLTSLAEDDTVLGSAKADGLPAAMLGKSFNLVSLNMEIDLEDYLDKFTPLLELEHDKEDGTYLLYIGKDILDKSKDETTYKKTDDLSKKEPIRLFKLEGSAGLALRTKMAIHYDPWEIKVLDSRIVVLGSIAGRWVYPICALPPAIPVYATVAAQGDLEVEGSLSSRSSKPGEKSRLALQSEAGFEIGIEGAIGLGARFARVYLEGGLNGTFLPKLYLPMKSLEEGLTLDVEGSAFLEGRILNLISTRVNVLESGTVRIWPKTSVNLLSLAEELEQMEYAVLPREYVAAEPISLVAGESFLGLDENCYPYSEVSLTPLADGRYLLVYTDDNLNREAGDRSVLRACIGTEGSDGTLIWGEAVTIEKDGTADFSFDTAVSGTDAAIVWQDAASTFGSGDTLTPSAAAAAISLSQTVLDCSGEIPVAGAVSSVAETGSLPYFPTVAYDGSTIRAAWVTSSNPNPAVYIETEQETLWLSENGGSASAVAKQPTSISGVALTDSSLLWVTGSENAASLWCCEDGSVNKLTEGSIQHLQSRNGQFCYVKDDVLYTGTSRSSTFFTAQGEACSNLLRLSADGQVYAAQLGTGQSRICALEDDKALPVGIFEGYVSSWDMADGHIVSVVRKGFSDDDGTVTASFVTAKKEEIREIQVNDAICGSQLAAPGSQVSLRIPVFNDGYRAITGLPVSLTAADGTVLFDDSVSCSVAPGSTQDVTMSFTVPEGFTEQEVELSVDGHTQRMMLGGSNLALAAEWSPYRSDGIQAEVSNTGMGQMSGTVRLTDPSGHLLEERSVTVAENTTETLWFQFDEYYTQSETLTLTLTEPKDNDTGDNTVVVRVAPAAASEILFQRELCLGVNQSAQLSARTFPAGSLLPVLTYRVADSSVAQVDENGVVTGLRGGETTVTATAPDGTAHEIAVTVNSDILALDICQSFRNVYDSVVLTKKNSSFTLQVTGKSTDLKDLTLRIAQYDTSGKMVSVKTVPCTISGTTAVFTDALPDDGKLFLLNTAQKPIIKALTFPLS